MNALMNLMPNIGGPKSSKRRVLAGVVHSQLLYAAPVWHSAVNNGKLMKRLNKIQRRLCIRVCSGYRTISLAAAEVIAGIPPIKLLVLERTERFNGVTRREANDTLLSRWQEEWMQQTYGRWTRRLIPNIQTWLDRKHGEIDYYLCQALSGHGCFRKYLFDRLRADSERCTYCGQLDDVEHTLFFCVRWEAVREEFFRDTGSHLTEGNIINKLLLSEESWQRTYATIRSIIENKEREAR